MISLINKDTALYRDCCGAISRALCQHDFSAFLYWMNHNNMLSVIHIFYLKTLWNYNEVFLIYLLEL